MLWPYMCICKIFNFLPQKQIFLDTKLMTSLVKQEMQVYEPKNAILKVVNIPLASCEQQL